MFRRLQLCPVTKTTRHKFDATSHQCGCGKWDRGYAPKKELVRPRAECQICERVQATDGNGGMTNHGYTRPGLGFIVGPCYGCGFAPYPATTALELYAKTLERITDGKRESLDALPTLQELHFTYTVGFGQKRESVTVAVKRGEERGEWVNNMRNRIPSFADLENKETLRLTGEIHNLTAESDRVAKRIAKALESQKV